MRNRSQAGKHFGWRLVGQILCSHGSSVSWNSTGLPKVHSHDPEGYLDRDVYDLGFYAERRWERFNLTGTMVLVPAYDEKLYTYILWAFSAWTIYGTRVHYIWKRSFARASFVDIAGMIMIRYGYEHWNLIFTYFVFGIDIAVCSMHLSAFCQGYLLRVRIQLFPSTRRLQHRVKHIALVQSPSHQHMLSDHRACMDGNLRDAGRLYLPSHFQEELAQSDRRLSMYQDILDTCWLFQ